MIDVEENTVIGVKPGVAYITARYVTDLPQPGGFVTYDTPSMKIIVRNESSDVRPVLCRRLNLRAAPSSSAARVGKLSRGQQVLVISESNGWAQLSDGSYAYAKYLDKTIRTLGGAGGSRPARFFTVSLRLSPGKNTIVQFLQLTSVFHIDLGDGRTERHRGTVSRLVGEQDTKGGGD